MRLHQRLQSYAHLENSHQSFFIWSSARVIQYVIRNISCAQFHLIPSSSQELQFHENSLLLLLLFINGPFHFLSVPPLQQLFTKGFSYLFQLFTGRCSESLQTEQTEQTGFFYKGGGVRRKRERPNNWNELLENQWLMIEFKQSNCMCIGLNQGPKRIMSG